MILIIPNNVRSCSSIHYKAIFTNPRRNSDDQESPVFDPWTVTEIGLMAIKPTVMEIFDWSLSSGDCTHDDQNIKNTHCRWRISTRAYWLGIEQMMTKRIIKPLS